MARISLIDPETRADLGPLVERVKGSRRGKLINVYRLLLHNPTLAGTWFEHVNAVRWATTLTGRLRELVIIRIGYLNRADYIIRQHVPKLALADGVSEAECAALADWQASNAFSSMERAVLAYTDALTRDAAVNDETYAAAARHFDERGILELTVLISTYNMHSRVMNALAIDLEQE